MNVKPGDLAIVITNPFAANLGAILRVIEHINLPHLDIIDAWMCDVEGRPLVGMHHGEMSSSDKHGNQIAMPDKYLRPISGLPLDEDVKDEATA